MSETKMVKDVKIKFKTGERRLATCVVDDAVKINKALESKDWAKVLKDFADAKNKSGLAFLLAVYSVHQAWRWVKIRFVEKDNALELQYEKAMEADFNSDVLVNMKDEVAANFKDLDKVVQEMLEEGDTEYKKKIHEILEHVAVNTVEIVGQVQDRLTAGTIVEGADGVTETRTNQTRNIRPTDKSGTTAGMVYKGGKNININITGGTEIVGGTSEIGDEGRACEGKKIVCATYLENTEIAQIHETGVQNRVVGSEGTEASHTKVKGGSGITVKKENVCEEIKGEGSNNTTAGSIVEGTQTFTEIREGGETHVDGKNAGGDSLTAGVVTRNGANAVLKFKNHSMTING